MEKIMSRKEMREMDQLRRKAVHEMIAKSTSRRSPMTAEEISCLTDGLTNWQELSRNANVHGSSKYLPGLRESRVEKTTYTIACDQYGNPLGHTPIAHTRTIHVYWIE